MLLFEDWAGAIGRLHILLELTEDNFIGTAEAECLSLYF